MTPAVMRPAAAFVCSTNGSGYTISTVTRLPWRTASLKSNITQGRGDGPVEQKGH